MRLILMVASCLKSAYEHANSTATPSHKYSFRNISENSGVESRTLGNIKAGILQMKPKYTVIPFEN